MLLIGGTIRLEPENLARARPAMRVMVEASRADDGCLHYSYAEDVLDPGLIHVAEAWRDQPALHRHFGSDHLATWRWSRHGGFGSTTRDGSSRGVG